MLALLDGLRRGGINLGNADRVVGTSAGALVGAALASGGLERALRLHRDRLLPTLETPASTMDVIAAAMQVAADAKDSAEAIRRMANLPPLGKQLVAEIDAKGWFGVHLGGSPWPKELLITAVDAASGDRAVFDACSGVALLDAARASCAAPGIFPRVTIDGRHYADGGLYSPYNADLAAGSSVVVVVSPLPAELRQPTALESELAMVGAAAVHLVFADEASVAAMGTNLMAPDTVSAALDAGAAQAAREVEGLRAAWLAGFS